MAKKRATIIIPTYNERENIAPTLQSLDKIFKQIKSWQMNVLVVDDTSPDKTYEAVKKLKKKYSWLQLLLNKKKAGLGGAYLKGMEHAFGKLKADVVFEFDADLSHDPEKIPIFLEKIEQGADLVLGSRYIEGGGIPQDWGLHRKFLSIVGNFTIMAVLTDFRIKDWTTGYRAVTKKVYQAVYRELGSERFAGYTFQIGFLLKAVRAGFLVKEVPFKFKDRVMGHSKIGAEYIKNTILFIIKVRWLEIIETRVFKFLVVGTIGTAIQLSSLQLLRIFVPPSSKLRLQVVNFSAIEIAIAFNFLLNNIWTFADKKLPLKRWPGKFLQFNLTSSGSILIQLAVFFIGVNTIGIIPVLTLPIVKIMLDTPVFFSATGIIIGLFWNFFAYNKFIWKSPPAS